MKSRLLFGIPVAILLIAFSVDIASIYRNHRHLARMSLHPELSSEKLDDLKNLVNKNFIKQSDGSYISEDATLLIKKISDGEKFKAPNWRRLLPGFAAMGNKCKQQRQKASLQKVCIKAYEVAPLETGLIYYQFEPTSYFDKQIEDLDLNQDSYYIQRIAIPSTERLQDISLKNAKSALTLIFDFVLQQRTRHRFKLPLDAFIQSIGFVDGRPIHNHLTNLTYDRKVPNQAELQTHFNELRSWLADNRPELIPHYNTLLEELN